ncbi:uridine phosphorylase [Candidatus Peregrinibacteria bacterium CG10_big_fil_rev_8_21_14_0_10_49_16]|nr:MAG: uridine phosphorylase [Candidatus Peregrinibacteria bacterium CG22_combo_CG10-13_8_21_14_all_49_11]PIR51952.1 MAG: uridine phosphorylase [Candidatus Peregrinibacteria bacterium CG10_big_fil_rev_8_21_14_0_10_49_16]
MVKWKMNPYLQRLQPDVFYHLGLDTDMNLMEMFGDVSVVCMGGSPARAQAFARYSADQLNIDCSLEPIGKIERFSLYKVGPVISVSHGMGMPSISILLHEVTKLLFHAGCDDPEYIRIGTSGGIGLNPGTVVISKEGVNAKLEPWHEQIVLGETQCTPTQLDPLIRESLLEHADGLPVATGKTLSVDDFYEQQARLDGALSPPFTHAQQCAYLQELHRAGVCNIEMETTMLAAFCHRAGIRAASVCATILNRLEDDQVHASPEELASYILRPQELVLRYIQARHMSCAR